MKHNQDQSNIAFLFVLTAFGLIALFSFIGQRTEFGTIYIAIFFMALIWYAFSKIAEEIFEFQFIDLNNFLWKVLAGIGLAMIFVGGAFFGQKQMSVFAFMSPLSAPMNAGGVLGFLPLLGQIFFIAPIVAFFEETLRSGLLRPTFAEWMSRRFLVPVLIFFGGMLLFFIPPFQILGAGLMLVSIVSALAFKFEIKSFYVRAGIAILVSASFFALLHLTAYQASTPMLIGALVFAILADAINTYFEDITTSVIAHTLNNSTVSCVSGGLGVWYALLVTAVTSGLIYMIGKARDL